MNQYAKLKKIIDTSQRIVVFTGAGISVPSGIPDFRSAHGVYDQPYGKYTPEEMISHSFFMKNPKLFFEFYGTKMVYRSAKPNVAHEYFSNLPNVSAVVTQNIDGLHQMAGSRNVFELHGSIHRNYCMKCHKFFSLSDINPCVPTFCSCGGLIKPDVVLYEEPLDCKVIYPAIDEIASADCLIIVGTSLVVYPAAAYIKYFKGKHKILINKSSTAFDEQADLVFNEDIIEVVEKIKALE